MAPIAASQSDVGKRYISSYGKSSSIAPSDSLEPKKSESQVEVGEIQLCVPSFGKTLAASSLGGTFIFFGLLLLNVSEGASVNETSEVWMILSARWLAWTCFYHIPIFVMSILVIRCFCTYGSAPSQFAAMIHPSTSMLSERARLDGWKSPRLIWFLLIFLHIANLGVYGLLFYIYIGEDKQYMGLILIHGCGHIICMVMSERAAECFLPTPLARTYCSRMGPSTLGTAMLGFLAVIVSYTLAFRFMGSWVSTFLPSLLSLYELVSTAILVRTFTKEFVQEKEVRKIYTAAGSNQGILVSSHICMLHAMADGARMILILAPITHNEGTSLDFLMPIISGFVWNILVRAGFLERFLFIISCGWKTTTRCNLLLQKVKYSTGCPHFFVLAAIGLVRLCSGHGLPPEQETLGYAILCLFLAECLENLVSWLLKSREWQVYPKWHPVGPEDLKAMAARQLQRRTSEIDFGDISNPTASVNTKGFRAECWKLRARFDFLYGPEDWGFLPYWAHVVPIFIAQFHTLLCIIFLCNGLPYVLGFCQGSYDGVGRALLWWPVTHDLCST